MKLLVADSLDEAAIQRMREAGIEVVVKTGLSAETLIREIPSYDAIATRSSTKLDRAVIEAATSLRLIVRAGVGLDNIDCAAAKGRGIAVRNTPNATSFSVAEHAIALLLALTHHIPIAHASLEAGRWEKKAFVGRELYGKRLGIIGLGRIGREVAIRTRAFGMEIIAHDPLVDPARASALRVPLLTLEEVLSRADVVSLHLPLEVGTQNLMSAHRLRQMKHGAILINCARGGLVDEAAVAAAVKQGHLAGAAFDVFAEEPLPASPLRGVPGILLTPHIGASTVEAQARAGEEVADIVIAFAAKAGGLP